MPTPHLPTHLLTQVWHKALPSVFVILVSGAGRFGELQLYGWTPVAWKRGKEKTSQEGGLVYTFPFLKVIKEN